MQTYRIHLPQRSKPMYRGPAFGLDEIFDYSKEHSAPKSTTHIDDFTNYYAKDRNLYLNKEDEKTRIQEELENLSVSVPNSKSSTPRSSPTHAECKNPTALHRHCNHASPIDKSCDYTTKQVLRTSKLLRDVSMCELFRQPHMKSFLQDLLTTTSSLRKNRHDQEAVGNETSSATDSHFSSILDAWSFSMVDNGSYGVDFSSHVMLHNSKFSDLDDKKSQKFEADYFMERLLDELPSELANHVRIGLKTRAMRLTRLKRSKDARKPRKTNRTEIGLKEGGNRKQVVMGTIPSVDNAEMQSEGSGDEISVHTGSNEQSSCKRDGDDDNGDYGDDESMASDMIVAYEEFQHIQATKTGGVLWGEHKLTETQISPTTAVTPAPSTASQPYRVRSYREKSKNEYNKLYEIMEGMVNGVQQKDKKDALVLTIPTIDVTPQTADALVNESYTIDMPVETDVVEHGVIGEKFINGILFIFGVKEVC